MSCCAVQTTCRRSNQVVLTVMSMTSFSAPSFESIARARTSVLLMDAMPALHVWLCSAFKNRRQIVKPLLILPFHVVHQKPLTVLPDSVVIHGAGGERIIGAEQA